MNLFIGIFTALIGLCGVFLAGRFAFMRLRGCIYEATVISFVKQQNKGHRLPVVEYENEALENIKAKTLSIDNVSYLISPAQKDGVVPILVNKDNPDDVRVYGYLFLILGISLLFPFLFCSVPFVFGSLVAAQFGFLFVLGVILGAAWLLLRLLRFFYY